jgi:hypothetical protein
MRPQLQMARKHQQKKGKMGNRASGQLNCEKRVIFVTRETLKITIHLCVGIYSGKRVSGFKRLE